MFIEKDDVVSIKIHFKKEGRKFLAHGPTTFKTLPDNEKVGFSELNLKMKEMGWGTYNDIQDRAMVEGENNDRIWNYKLFKENKLKTLIVSWDAKDKSGKPVPVNENTIKSLAPAIAETILVAYDDLSILGEEEEKK